MCSFQCLHHQPVFQKKAASLPKMAILLWYLTEDLNLLGLFDDNLGLTTKYVIEKVISKKINHCYKLEWIGPTQKTKHLLSLSPKTVEG